MRKYTRPILVLSLLMILVCAAARLLMGRTYRTSFVCPPAFLSDSLPVPENDDPDTVRIENVRLEGNRLFFEAVPLQPGAAFVSFVGRDGRAVGSVMLRVDRLMTVYNENTGGFNGDLVFLVALTVYLLLLSAMMLHGYLSAKGPAFYAYSTIFYIGFFFFTLVTGLAMLNITLRHLIMGEAYSMLDVYDSLCGASSRFINYTCPLLLVFSAALAASNIALLRHNRPRIQNVMGLVISFLVLGGAVLGIWLSARSFSGSLAEYRAFVTVENVYCTVYVYFECILAGAAVCAFRAARRKPPADRDVIIILGCWFRKDGTLPPLLRGRVDRAIEYWKQHREKTGREAYIIPSGGQGRDEPMPEAEAMKAYLIAQGIPERLILPETRSKDTLENLRFSGLIMKDHHLSGSVIFATTNYHVFRSGLWAAQAGLDAEGIGSRTKWWFWPNAFIRECIGLIANKWKRELVMLVLLAAFFGLLSMTIIG